MKLHPETLITNQRPVMAASAPTTRSWEAYLAGGMATALQLGHRISADFDWFTKKTINPNNLLADVRSLGFPVKVDQNDEGTFLGQVGGIKYSVFRYKYDLAGPTVAFDGCSLASLSDIGAMKLAAICQRAEKRDYVNVHAIITTGHIPLSELVAAWNQKYPGKPPSVAIKGLIYFKDVEHQPMPEMRAKTSWEDVKKGLERAVARLKG